MIYVNNLMKKGAACAVVSSVCMSVCAAASVLAERPYAFRERLEKVHARGVRDQAAVAAAGEFAFADGAIIAIPADAGEVLENAAKDFVDYLFVSQGVSAPVKRRGIRDQGSGIRDGVSISFDVALKDREYVVEVAEGVRIRAKDERTAAQALYHLEDLMNLRRAPFLKKGTETRRMRFRTRMVHSAWGMDLAPEKYIERMAHYGYDALLVYVKRVGETKSVEAFADVNAIIRRAKKHGVDVWLYTSVKADVHPDDPGAQKVFDDSYGEIARAYPEAKGLVLVGESCKFPSKDERACSDPFEVKQARGDKRPAPGWFPCRDYPDWLSCVKKAINRHAPDMKVLFWTYNWSKDWTPETPGARMELIDHLPRKNTILLSTFELPEQVTFSNGYSVKVSDYSITVPGPGKVFSSEAVRAKAKGLELFTMCNTGGHTWDFGTSPYQPVPFQWAKRWRALVKAHDDWGLSGLMETHHYGWFPNFVSELAKEAYVEGGLLFDEHIRRIAARDFGAANADEVVAIWNRWSDGAANHPPTIGNQYGPCRIGPAYPFNFGGKRIEKGEFPNADYAAYGIGICHLNYTEELWGERMYYPATEAKEIELLTPYADGLMDGARRFDEMAKGLSGLQAAKAREMSVLGEYIGRSVRTAINLKRGALAWEAKDRATLLEIAKEEYANASAALPLVDADSTLGFEPSMEYGGGREQIEWKLKRMKDLYWPEAGK